MLMSIPYSPVLAPATSRTSPNGMIARLATAVTIAIAGASAISSGTPVLG